MSHYRHPDWLGSNRLESSASNHSILGDNAYAPFGEPYAQTGNGEISFTGANKDTTWLQYDFVFRQYDPKQGRWISPDPAGQNAVDPSDPQTWNRYAYVRNSPLNNVDPLGLDGWDDWGGWGGGFGWGDFCGDFMPCAGSGGGAILPGMLPNFITPNQGIGLQTLFFGPMCSMVQDCAMDAVGKQEYKDCINDFYNSKEGQLVSFLSPISLVPGWNPHAWENMKSWAETILTKGALFGSTYSKATGVITTLNGTQSIAAPLETATVAVRKK